jgi:hypothetical protein
MSIKVVKQGKEKDTNKKSTVRPAKAAKCGCVCDCYCPPDYRTSNAQSAHVANEEMYK